MKELPKQKILELARSHGATSVKIFGSVARGEAVTGDLDVLVTLEPQRDLLDLIALQQDLEQELGVSVDVVTEQGLSPFLREQILSEAIAI
ncbi:MAG: nucleotidyltransferase family protein [Trueperaceae bacterium]